MRISSPIDITAAASQGYQPYCPSMEQVISRFGRPLVQTLLELLAQNKDGDPPQPLGIFSSTCRRGSCAAPPTMLRAILSELEGQGMVLAGKTRQGDPAVRIRAAVFGRPACGRVSPSLRGSRLTEIEGRKKIMSQTVREVVVAAYGRTGIAKARKGLHLTHPVDFTGQLLAGVVRKGCPSWL